MIVVIAGAGGVGKGAVARRLVELDPGVHLSRSWTTRRRRIDDVEGAYTYVDRAAFADRIEAGGFLEHAEFLGNLYGTPLPGPELGVADLLLEIDAQGAELIRARFPKAVVVLIVAPDAATHEARLRSRGDGDEHVRLRLAVGTEEEARLRRMADEVVVNDDLDVAAATVAAILARRRSRHA